MQDLSLVIFEGRENPDKSFMSSLHPDTLQSVKVDDYHCKTKVLSVKFCLQLLCCGYFTFIYSSIYLFISSISLSSGVKQKDLSFIDLNKLKVEKSFKPFPTKKKNTERG